MAADVFDMVSRWWVVDGHSAVLCPSAQGSGGPGGAGQVTATVTTIILHIITSRKLSKLLEFVNRVNWGYHIVVIMYYY